MRLSLKDLSRAASLFNIAHNYFLKSLKSPIGHPIMWGENSLKMWDPQAKISLAGARAGKMLFPLFLASCSPFFIAPCCGCWQDKCSYSHRKKNISRCQIPLEIGHLIYLPIKIMKNFYKSCRSRLGEVPKGGNKVLEYGIIIEEIEEFIRYLKTMKKRGFMRKRKLQNI